MKIKITFIMTVAFYGWFIAVNSASAQTWTQTSAPIKAWTCIALSADGAKMVAGTYEGEIYTSIDLGRTWDLKNASSNRWLCVALSANGSVLAASGNAEPANAFLVSTNSEIDWFQVPTLTNTLWASVAISADGSRLLALAEAPKEIVTSTNFGSSWTTQTKAPTLDYQYYWNWIASSADGTKLVAVTYNGGPIYRSTNSGVT